MEGSGCHWWLLDGVFFLLCFGSWFGFGFRLGYGHGHGLTRRLFCFVARVYRCSTALASGFAGPNRSLILQ